MSWAALDRGGELLGGGGDLEQLRGQRLVGGDLLGQAACPCLVGQQPDHLRVVAVLSLEGAAGQVSLVVVALGQQPRWMLGVQVDLEQPVIFCACVCCRDCFQIRLEPAPRPTEPQPGAPAGRLGTQSGQASTDGVNGLLDDRLFVFGGVVGGAYRLVEVVVVRWSLRRPVWMRLPMV